MAGAVLLGQGSAFAQRSQPNPWPETRVWIDEEEARRRAAAEDLRRLHKKMEEFVQAWNDFTHEYSARGVFNVKKARRVREAWRALEKENTWPR
ncbi:MAG: hypothetical protein HYR60_14110 [Acidobacteria bacterium]|nr:hypothetical protein [Acidobacteriota bacterium]